MTDLEERECLINDVRNGVRIGALGSHTLDFVSAEKGDILVVTDEYSHDIEHHYVRVESFEIVEDAESILEGIKFYVTDLDAASYGDDYIGTATIMNFVAKSNDYFLNASVDISDKDKDFVNDWIDKDFVLEDMMDNLNYMYFNNAEKIVKNINPKYTEDMFIKAIKTMGNANKELLINKDEDIITISVRLEKDAFERALKEASKTRDFIKE